MKNVSEICGHAECIKSKVIYPSMEREHVQTRGVRVEWPMRPGYRPGSSVWSFPPLHGQERDSDVFTGREGIWTQGEC